MNEKCGYGCGRVWDEEGGTDGFDDCVSAYHRKSASKERSIESEVFNTRMLVFLEVDPCSNKYRQVYLNAEEFRKVAFAFGRETGEKMRNGTPIVEFQQSEEEYELPDLKQINV